MLLAINIGNKIMNAKVFSGKNVMASFDLSTCVERTSDEYGATLVSILRAKKFDLKEIDSAVINSQVSEVTKTFEKALADYLRCFVLVVKEGDALNDSDALDDLRNYYEQNGPKERESRGIMVY